MKRNAFRVGIYMGNRWEAIVSSSKWSDLIKPGYWVNRDYWDKIGAKKTRTLYRMIVPLIDIIELLIPLYLFLCAHRFLFFYPLITVAHQLIIYLIVLVIIGIFLLMYWKLVSRPIRYLLTLLWASNYLVLLCLYNIDSIEFLFWVLPLLIWLSLVYYKFYKDFIKSDDWLFQPQKRGEDNKQGGEFFFRPGSYNKRYGLLLNKGVQSEKEFYDRFLKKAVAGMHIQIFAKVGLKDLVETNKNILGKCENIYFNKISQKHIDFVLCDKKSLEILLAIEYDGKYHIYNEKARHNDEEKNTICKTAGLPLLRISTNGDFTVESLRQIVISYIGLRCADCGNRLTPGIEKYCQSYPKRFDGRNYCMDCQNNYL